MAKPARKPIPQATELRIYDQSRRRCALCFSLSADLAEKLGQIAHLDQNPANFSEDNLAFLCLDHHSLYDSTTSQHKNYTMAEIKAARAKLYEAIGKNRHVANTHPHNAGRETDRTALSDLVHAMSGTRTMDFMRDADFGDWSFHWRELNALDEYVQFPRGAEREFVDRDLEALRQNFIAEYAAFRPLLWQYTAPTPWTPTYRTVPADWRDTQPERYAETVQMLRAAADKVCGAYDELVRTARERLAL